MGSRTSVLTSELFHIVIQLFILHDSDAGRPSKGSQGSGGGFPQRRSFLGVAGTPLGTIGNAIGVPSFLAGGLQEFLPVVARRQRRANQEDKG